MGGSPEESDQQGDLLEKSVQTRLYVQNEDTMTQKSGSVVPKEACSLVKVPDSHTGNDQNICDNMVNEDVPYPGNLQSMDPCASDSAKSVNDAKRNLLDIGTYSDCMGSSEHDQGQLDIEDAATSNVSKKTLGDTKFEKQDENLVKKLDLATVNRAPGSAVEQPASRPLAGATSTKAPEEVTQSQRNSGKLIPLPGGNPEKEKQLTLTSSLKRKTYETASTNTMSCSPLKRLSESPVQSRSCKEASPKLVVSGQMKEVSVFFENKGDVKSRNSLDDSSPQVEISRVKNMVDYEFTALVENDGNVEEAEAYTKELEDVPFVFCFEQPYLVIPSLSKTFAVFRNSHPNSWPHRPATVITDENFGALCFRFQAEMQQLGETGHRRDDHSGDMAGNLMEE
ncbi:hypothetical protein CRG98_006842 [Punica granatum]|uniref:Uncharacterized protein n=1 Tax=Punica granatum TaxID=22663 RepID=A0A2I0KWB6_PUNGR|nr:hypothetical protein CRG98_006842 [Punica granatum]